MRTDVFTCDEPGCPEKLERYQGRGLPEGWHEILVPHGEPPTPPFERALKPVYLCPKHTKALVERYQEVPLPVGGRRVEKPS